MTSSDDTRTNARKILYLLTAQQRLRAGDHVALDALKLDLDRHGMAAQDQQEALDYAKQQGWLADEPPTHVVLTEQGFGLNFGQ